MTMWLVFQHIGDVAALRVHQHRDCRYPTHPCYTLASVVTLCAHGLICLCVLFDIWTKSCLDKKTLMILLSLDKKAASDFADPNKKLFINVCFRLHFAYSFQCTTYFLSTCSYNTLIKMLYCFLCYLH